jgi:hypothetical protein
MNVMMLLNEILHHRETGPKCPRIGIFWRVGPLDIADPGHDLVDARTRDVDLKRRDARRGRG